MSGALMLQGSVGPGVKNSQTPWRRAGVRKKPHTTDAIVMSEPATGSRTRAPVVVVVYLTFCTLSNHIGEHSIIS